MRPRLVITEQPRSEIRFRYKTEIKTGHGVIKGQHSFKKKSTYPTVKLMNYDGVAHIRCTLYQVDLETPSPHPHQLFIDKTNSMQYLMETSNNVAAFNGLHIIQSPIKHVISQYVENQILLRKFDQPNYLVRSMDKKLMIRQLSKNGQIKSIDLNRVRLRFDAFKKRRDGSFTPICEHVFTNGINNLSK